MTDDQNAPAILARLREKLLPLQPSTQVLAVDLVAGSWIVDVAVVLTPDASVDRIQELAGEAFAEMDVESFAVEIGEVMNGQEVADDEEQPLDHPDKSPRSMSRQTCAFCDSAPVWMHPLDPAKTAFRRTDGTRISLPGFWTVCSRCEGLNLQGRDNELAQLFSINEGVDIRDARVVAAAFRAADLGPQGVPSEHTDGRD